MGQRYGVAGEDLTDAEILEAATLAARTVGETSDPVRMGADAIHPVVRVGSVVVRLEIGEAEKALTRRLAYCTRMCSAGVSFVVPAAAAPLRVPNGRPMATLWEYVDRAEPLDWAALGRALASLHAFGGNSARATDPAPERLARAIDSHPSLQPELSDRFRAMVDRIGEILSVARWSDQPLRPSHGDLWIKNVIPRGTGRVALCDFDFLGVRPTACDLGLLYRELEGDDRWCQVAEAYGSERVPPTELLRAGYDAAMIDWIAYVLERRRGWVEYTKQLAQWEPGIS